MPKTPELDDLEQQIEVICIEKGLEPEEVLKAIEVAIASAYRKEFGVKENAYEAEFDKDTRTYKIFDTKVIVSEVVAPEREIDVIEAKLSNPSIQVGDKIRKQIEVDKKVQFSRIASQVARQVIFQAINNAKHTKVLQKFKDKIGEVVTVEIDYYKKGGYAVKLADTIGFIPKENLSPLDRFKSGQLIKALIFDIFEDDRGNLKIQLDRASGEFIKAILKNEIPEIDSGIVTVDKIVREPGFRTKILVSASEGENIDPVGTILGRKNVRLTNVIREISPTMQERLDVIENQPKDIETMVYDALEPAEIDSVEINYENRTAKVYCYAEEAALAVGKKGVNIRLAGRLLDLELELVKLEGEAPSTYGNYEISVE
jgi:transcription termination/antitermination protein NusA